MKKEYCDRCGKEFKSWEIRAIITIHSKLCAVFNFDRTICSSCKSKLMKWLKE